MPFRKIKGTDKYKSPSGKTYTLDQIRAYYTNKRKSKKRLKG